MNRREGLAALAVAFALPGTAVAAPAAGPFLAAAWDDDTGHRIGLLRASDGRLHVAASTVVPTRAHGLLWEAGGSLLAVARRPGDWLVRWHPGRRALQRVWTEPDRSFNGHVLAGRDGRTLYTTETDLASGAGLVAVRDARSLERRAEWPSHGPDPHALLLDAEGRLVVANGGIPTQPETGRAKRGLERMDASLVRLDPARGRLLGQWRLDDPRLSLRHLAAQGPRLGIALQAEHDDDARRSAAPVLALFDGERLRVAEPARALAGYGGDIAAWGPKGGFAVACPRAGGIARWRADGGWAGFTALAGGCALAATPHGVWAGGTRHALSLGTPSAALALPALRLDNHWVVAAAAR